jgi:hypothetical protein
MTWRVRDTDVVHPGPTKRFRGPLGGATHVTGVLRQRADTRNREVLLQFIDVPIAIDVDEI